MNDKIVVIFCREIMFCIEKRVRWKNFLIYFLGIHILISTGEQLLLNFI